MNTQEIGNVERRARRMREMIHRLDVDRLELAYADLGDVYAMAANTCLSCENTSACLLWLEAAPQGAERPLFCPNLELFKRFAASA